MKKRRILSCDLFEVGRLQFDVRMSHVEKQRFGDVRRGFRCLHGLVEVSGYAALVRLHGCLDQPNTARDDLKKIVEVMGDAAGYLQLDFQILRRGMRNSQMLCTLI